MIRATLVTALTLALPGALAAQVGPPPGPGMPHFQSTRIDPPAQPDAVPLYPAATISPGPVPEIW